METRNVLFVEIVIGCYRISSRSADGWQSTSRKLVLEALSHYMQLCSQQQMQGQQWNKNCATSTKYVNCEVFIQEWN